MVSLFATKKDQEAGFEKVLPKFQAAWNKGDVAEFMKLFHADSKMQKAWQIPEKKDKVAAQLAAMIEVFGVIKESKMGVYIERKDRFVVKFVYSKKGEVPGTMVLKLSDGGKWYISDWNIDGQGEPELKQ